MNAYHLESLWQKTESNVPVPEFTALLSLTNLGLYVLSSILRLIYLISSIIFIRNFKKAFFPTVYLHDDIRKVIHPFSALTCINFPAVALCVWYAASKLSWLKCGVVLWSSAYEETSSTCQCTDRSSTEGCKREGVTHVCLGSEKESLQLDWELAKWEEMVKCRPDNLRMGEQREWGIYSGCLPDTESWVRTRDNCTSLWMLVSSLVIWRFPVSYPFSYRFQGMSCIWKMLSQDLDWTDKVQFLIRMAFKMLFHFTAKITCICDSYSISLNRVEP